MVSAALSCANCGEVIEEGARFCSTCGRALTAPACNSCGRPLVRDSRLCANCGSPADIPKIAENASSLAHLITAIQLLVKHSHPERILTACSACLQHNLPPSLGALASVITMSSFAQLGRFAEAEQAILKSRRLYAAHLGLPAEQQAMYVESGYSSDISKTTNDIQQNPWLYFILGDTNRPSLSKDYRGETEAAKRKTACEVWSSFFNDLVPIRGVLAYLLFENKQYHEAATLLESLLLIARKYEGISPVRIELAWPRTILGECYWASGQVERASEEWKRVRSLDLCISIDPEIDDWSRLAVPWIDWAKSRLTDHSISVPSQEDSFRASEHLKQAVSSLIEAEQFTDGGSDFDEFSSMIQRAGRRYLDPIRQAAASIEAVEKLDPFVWAKCPTRDSYFWCRLELAKSLFLQKYALLHVSNDKLALAAASSKQANELWPSLSTSCLMAAFQTACGLVSDANATYRSCLDRAEELGAVEASDDREQILKEIRQALSGHNQSSC